MINRQNCYNKTDCGTVGSFSALLLTKPDGALFYVGAEILRSLVASSAAVSAAACRITPAVTINQTEVSGGDHLASDQPLPPSQLVLQTIHRFHNRFSQSQRRPLQRAFSWLKAPTSTFTFKTLSRHYAKQALTPR